MTDWLIFGEFWTQLDSKNAAAGLQSRLAQKGERESETAFVNGGMKRS
jgi:hypothetical protein